MVNFSDFCTSDEMGLNIKNALSYCKASGEDTLVFQKKSTVSTESGLKADFFQSRTTAGMSAKCASFWRTSKALQLTSAARCSLKRTFKAATKTPLSF